MVHLGDHAVAEILRFGGKRLAVGEASVVQHVRDEVRQARRAVQHVLQRLAREVVGRVFLRELGGEADAGEGRLELV